MEHRKIFISYRREDSSGESGRLKDKLEQTFGKDNIFYDVETLEAGLNFDQSIAKALSESKVLLAMIGPHWLKVADSKGTLRIQKPEDWVRKEIAEAIKRGIRVIPILVNGAEMPDPDELPEDLKELSLKHAQELTSSRWNYDVGELTKVLEKFILKKAEPKPKAEPKETIIATPPPYVPPVIKQKSWIAKNYLYVLGGVVAFFTLIGLITPPADSEYQEETQTPVELAADTTVQEGSYSGMQSFTGEVSNIVPELGVEWVLIEERNDTRFETSLVFYTTEEGIFFEEYEGENVVGGGSVQIDNQNLVLIYSTSNYDSTGKVIMETLDSGNTWSGKSNYPLHGATYNSTLARKTNP
jgi:hypothetical protein